MDKEDKLHRTYVSKVRRRTAITLSVACLVCVFISFVSPYWIQRWPRIHTSFRRIGLWEFCMDGWISRTDPQMQAYFGCWWILAPYYDRVKEILVPAWFVIVQILMTLTLLLQIAINVVFAIYLNYGKKQQSERKTLFSKILLICQGITSLFLFSTSMIFGVRCQDRYWMPAPSLNWPSWSYGLAVLACFFSLLDCPLLWFMHLEDREDVNQAVNQFPMQSKSSARQRGPTEADKASTII